MIDGWLPHIPQLPMIFGEAVTLHIGRPCFRGQRWPNPARETDSYLGKSRFAQVQNELRMYKREERFRHRTRLSVVSCSFLQKYLPCQVNCCVRSSAPKQRLGRNTMSFRPSRKSLLFPRNLQRQKDLSHPWDFKSSTM